MRGATEHEQPVHLLQSAQLDLPKRTSLLQPPKALFDQPAGRLRLIAYPGGRVVLRSRLLLWFLSFLVMCGVTFSSRTVRTKSSLSYALSAPTVMRCARALLLSRPASTAQHRALRSRQRESPSPRRSTRCGSQRKHGQDNSTSIPSRSSSLYTAHPDQWWTRCVSLLRFCPQKPVPSSSSEPSLEAKTLLRSPGLDQRAVYGQVLVRHELLRLLVHLGEEMLGHIRGQQPIAVLRRTPHGSTPHRPSPRPTNQSETEGCRRSARPASAPSEPQ